MIDVEDRIGVRAPPRGLFCNVRSAGECMLLADGRDEYLEGWRCVEIVPCARV